MSRQLSSTFLADVGVDQGSIDLSRTQISFQPHYYESGALAIPDASITYDDELSVIIEAKVGRAGLSKDQLVAYAAHLARSSAQQKRLVCITQIDDRANFEVIKPALIATSIKATEVVNRKWYEILDLLSNCVGLSADIACGLDTRILQGKVVSYEHRLSHLFLKEVQDSMYMKRVVDELPAGELDDIVVVTQTPWFMHVAHKYGVWFPSGSLKYGLRPARYVAFYETGDHENKNPSQIAFLARNRVFWNRITVPDARQQPELRKLFADASVSKEIDSWRNPEETFHVALADRPESLAHPITLGKKKYARILSKRRYAFPVFINARTVDDLIP